MTTVHGELLAGRWRLGDQIGRGAVADVHEAVDDGTGERVAVKILRHADPGQRVRFEREVTALESLEHENVVKVLGHGELDGRPYLVLERIDGGSLADAIAIGPLSPARAATIGAALADALDHAHARGVVHRDVKPSNVLLDGDGIPRLADFGVAQLDGLGTLTASGFTVGTAAYLAPEQVRGEPVGPAADVYALGLLVLEAATGQRAYEGSGVTAAMARLERSPEVPDTLPGPLASRLRAMTAMAPADRPTTEAVARDLAVLADGIDDGGTDLLPVADDATELVAVAAAAPAPHFVVPAPVLGPDGSLVDGPVLGEAPAAAPVAVRRRFPWRSTLVAAACFAVGFLLVVAAQVDEGVDVPATPATTVVTTPTTATTVATTAAPPPTTPPPTTAAPAPPGPGNGNGNGRDRDRDRDRDD